MILKCPLSSDKAEKKEGGDCQEMVSVPICHQQPRILWASYSQVFSDIVRSCKNGCMKQSHHKADHTHQNDAKMYVVKGG